LSLAYINKNKHYVLLSPLFINSNSNRLQVLSSKCNICDDDRVEDLHHFVFEWKTLRGIRQKLFEEMETAIKSFYPDLAFSELPPFQKLQFLIGDFCLSFNSELGFLLDQFSKKTIR
jgi:hypothetical protein